MLNPNIEMLENLISAAVSTRYKEVPPTEEEFFALAQNMRATLSTLPVTDEEFAEILVRLRASIVIQMDVGVYILFLSVFQQKQLLLIMKSASWKIKLQMCSNVRRIILD